MAVDPALGVNHVTHAGARSAHGELVGTAGELAGIEVFYEFILGFFVGYHELDIVAGCPAHIAAAVFVGDIADFADMGDGHGAGAAAAHGIDLGAAFGNMQKHAGFKDFMIGPFAEVLGDDGREILVVFVRADVRDSAFHGFFRIVASGYESHCGIPQILALMAFAVICQTAVPAAGHFRFLEEDERIAARILDLAGLGGHIRGFQEFLEGKPLHGLADSLAVLAFFHPPVPNVFNQFLDFVVGLLHFHKWHKHAAHLGAVNDGGLGADEDCRAALVANVQGLWHGVDAVHATHAFPGLDAELP